MNPTESEILAEQHRIGSTREDAITRLTSRIARDEHRIAKVAPEASEEIAKAVAAAETATAKAQELLSSRRAVLDDLMASLEQLARQRAEIVVIRGFQITEATEARLAEEALEAFLANHRSESPNARSEYDIRLHHLAHAKALNPHIPGFVAKLEAAANKAAGEIRALAQQNKIDLPNLIEVMAHEAGPRAGETSARNSRLLAEIGAGFLNDFKAK
jgi:hypothetical protein